MLKGVFYEEFKDVEGVIYDAEEDSDSFVDVGGILEELER